MRLNWLLLGSAILLEVVATLSLRAAAGFTHPWWYVPVVVGYLGAFWALSTILARGMPLGVAYGTWAATGIALVAVLGALIFGDALSWTTGIGIVLIIGGVLLLELGSQRAMDRRRAAEAAQLAGAVQLAGTTGAGAAATSETAEPRIDGSGVNG